MQSCFKAGWQASSEACILRLPVLTEEMAELAAAKKQ